MRKGHTYKKKEKKKALISDFALSLVIFRVKARQAWQ